MAWVHQIKYLIFSSRCWVWLPWTCKKAQWRLAMIGFVASIVTELMTGESLIHAIELWQSHARSTYLMKNMKVFSAIAVITLITTPAQASMRTKVPNLLMEKLYYAEGRQHKDHPLHGSFSDLCCGADSWGHQQSSYNEWINKALRSIKVTNKPKPSKWVHIISLFNDISLSSTFKRPKQWWFIGSSHSR